MGCLPRERQAHCQQDPATAPLRSQGERLQLGDGLPLGSSTTTRYRRSSGTTAGAAPGPCRMQKAAHPTQILPKGLVFCLLSLTVKTPDSSEQLPGACQGLS